MDGKNPNFEFCRSLSRYARYDNWNVQCVFIETTFFELAGNIIWTNLDQSTWNFNCSFKISFFTEVRRTCFWFYNNFPTTFFSKIFFFKCAPFGQKSIYIKNSTDFRSCSHINVNKKLLFCSRSKITGKKFRPRTLPKKASTEKCYTLGAKMPPFFTSLLWKNYVV